MGVVQPLTVALLSIVVVITCYTLATNNVTATARATAAYLTLDTLNVDDQRASISLVDSDAKKFRTILQAIAL